ncbi:MAG: hypothetical protein PHU70_00475 [Dehalococcoidia bacterium]|nr:hypothetical protein [Dehalococcoidia bacterium]
MTELDHKAQCRQILTRQSCNLEELNILLEKMTPVVREQFNKALETKMTELTDARAGFREFYPGQCYYADQNCNKGYCEHCAVYIKMIAMVQQQEIDVDWENLCKEADRTRGGKSKE